MNQATITHGNFQNYLQSKGVTDVARLEEKQKVTHKYFIQHLGWDETRVVTDDKMAADNLRIKSNQLRLVVVQSKTDVNKVDRDAVEIICLFF